jgi:hypothetical protein
MTLLAALTRRTSRLASRRWLRLALLISSCIVLLDLWLTVRITAPESPAAIGNGNSNAIGIGSGAGSGDEGARFRPQAGHSSGKKKEKLFIASIHWNDERILTAHWIPALLSLVDAYGAENLYISIHESGSWDNTKKLLRDLDARLGERGVERTVLLEEKTHEDVIKMGEDEIQAGAKKEGWIMGSRGRMEMRRIPYLAAARNKAMMPLRELAGREGEAKKVFDRVVWLNDVIFTVRSLLSLSSNLPQSARDRTKVADGMFYRQTKSPPSSRPATAPTQQPAPSISPKPTNSTTPSQSGTCSAYQPSRSYGPSSPPPPRAKLSKAISPHQ